MRDLLWTFFSPFCETCLNVYELLRYRAETRKFQHLSRVSFSSSHRSLTYQAVRVIIFTFVQWHATWEEKFPRIFWFLLPWAVRIPSSGSIELVPRNCPILDWGGSKTSLIFHGGQRMAWISVSMHTGVFWHEKVNGDVYKVERCFWMAVYQKIFTIFARPVSLFAKKHFFYREMKSAWNFDLEDCFYNLVALL